MQAVAESTGEQPIPSETPVPRIRERLASQMQELTTTPPDRQVEVREAFRSHPRANPRSWAASI